MWHCMLTLRYLGRKMFFGIIFNEKVKQFKIMMEIIFCQHLDQLY